MIRYPIAVLPSTLGQLPLTPPELYPYLLPTSNSIDTDISTTINVSSNDNDIIYLQVEISDIFNKSYGSIPLSSLAKDIHPNIKKIKILSCKHMDASITSYCTEGIKIKSMNGLKTVSIDDYIDKIKINSNSSNDNDNIHIVLPLVEELPLLLDLPSKRIYKANERSTRWFNYLRKAKGVDWNNLKLFGVAIPLPPDHKINNNNQKNKENDIIRRIIDSCKILISNGVKGIVIGGAFQGTNYNCHSIKIDLIYITILGETIEYLCQVISNVKQAIKGMNLTEHIPIMIQGADTVPSIMQVIEAGADIVAGRLTVILSKKGRALRWKKYLNDDDNNNTSSSIATIATIATNNNKDSTVSNNDDNNDLSKLSKKRSIISISNDENNDNSNEDNDVHAIQMDKNYTDDYSINLWDDKYFNDSRPIQYGCACHACRYHTRAYIHHLLKAKELLAEILLHAHNQKQYLELFESFRL